MPKKFARKRKFITSCAVLLISTLIGYGASFLFARYRIQEEMIIPITELSTLDYPDDPAHLSTFYERYGNRYLQLVKKEGSQFDFHLKSNSNDVADISIFDVDLSLYVPIIPHWIKGDPFLEKVALIEREWNQQAVSFSPNSTRVKIHSGDGFEKNHLISIELIKNCLNAGLWEIQLYTVENGEKALYYHGWFNFPLGHYKNVFEKSNNITYWKYWRPLEHWVNLPKKKVNLHLLREIIDETQLTILDTSHERILAKGEQNNKLRTFSAKSVLAWQDFPKKREKIAFATFIAPGCYQFSRRWSNEYGRIASLEKVILKNIKSPATSSILQEIECVYKNPESNEICRFFFSGFNLNDLPKISEENYPLGLEMPMGISLPPVFQTYPDLCSHRPSQSPFFSLLLDDEMQIIDHKKAAIDGAIIHRDFADPNLIHLYLLSYERHSLIAHYKLSMDSCQKMCYSKTQVNKGLIHEKSGLGRSCK